MKKARHILALAAALAVAATSAPSIANADQKDPEKVAAQVRSAAPRLQLEHPTRTDRGYRFAMRGGGLEVDRNSSTVKVELKSPKPVSLQVKLPATRSSAAVAEDGTIVQTVSHRGGGFTYPVIADPQISFGAAIYMTYSKAETKKYAAYTAYGTISAALCAFIPVPVGQAACIAAAGGIAVSLDKTFNEAAAAGRCVQVSVPYLFASPAWLIAHLSLVPHQVLGAVS